MGNGDKSMLVEPFADEHLPNGDVLMNHDEICGGADARLILLVSKPNIGGRMRLHEHPRSRLNEVCTV